MKKTNPMHVSFTILTVIFCWLFVSLPAGAVPLTESGAVIPGINLNLYPEADAGQLLASTCHLGPLPVDGIAGPFIGYDPSGNIVFTGQYHEFVGTDPITGALTFCFAISQDQNTIGLEITDVGLSDVSGFSLDADYLYGGPAGATLPGPVGGVLFPNSLVRSYLFGPFLTSPLLPLDPIGNMAVLDFGFLYPFQFISTGQGRGEFVISTNAKTYTKGKMYIYSPFGPGGLAQVDAFIPGPALIPQSILQTPPQPPSSTQPNLDGLSCMPQYYPNAKNLVFITHGYNSHGKRKPGANEDDNWVVTMADKIRSVVNIAQSNPLNWNVCAYDWENQAKPLLWVPKTIWHNAANLGSYYVGPWLFNQKLEHIHFIAHSMGGNLIQHAIDSLVQPYQNAGTNCGALPLPPECLLPPKPIIHSTFLDAYFDGSYAGNYGDNADWSEQYVDTYLKNIFDIFRILNKGTRIIIPHTYNFNVTNISHSIDPIDNPSLDEHFWPRRWYASTILNSTPLSYQLAKYGFPMSLESGRSSLPPKTDNGLAPGEKYFPTNNGSQCDLSLSISASQDNCGFKAGVALPVVYNTTTVATNTPTDFSAAQAANQLLASATGSTTITSPTSLQTATGSPAWVTMFVDTASAINALQFDYGFQSTAEGLLSVAWDGDVIRQIDERNTPTGTNHTGEILLGDVVPGRHALSFRLDAYTSAQSVIDISNVSTGLRSFLNAQAGLNQTLYQGRSVTLDGSGSADTRDIPLSFAWSQTGGPSVPLSDPAAVKPTFVAPAVSISGQAFTFRLTVTNNDGGSAADAVTVTVAKLGDVNVNNSIDTIDLNLVLAARGTPASGPNDLRDLDSDGMITALDARKLTTLCTRPRCATQ